LYKWGGVIIMKRYSSWALSLLLLSYTAFQGNIIVHASGASVQLSPSEVTITNNVGKSDTIYVTDVMGGDTINVYNAATGGKLIGKTTVSGAKTDATVNISQLGTNAGSVYVSVTSKGMTESIRTEIDYDAESISDAPLPENVTITNNSGKADTVYVCGLAQGDVVKLYTSATKGKLLGTATVGGNRTDTTISLSQLGVNGGSIYLSVASKGMKESSRIKVDFSAESQSDCIDPSNVTITNNAGKPDNIYISGLAAGDKVKVYTAITGGKLLGSSSVSSNSTETTLNISQLGVYGGSVYISATSLGMAESSRTKVDFSAEGQADSILTSNVTVTNNSGKADTVYVTGLSLGDKVSVYNASTGGNMLGSATASSDGTATASIGQLGNAAGSVYISVTRAGIRESSRVKMTYDAESQSNTLNADNITVTNNSGKADTVYISGVYQNELVKVYNSSTGGKLLGSTKVLQNSTDATVSISQIGISAGSVYVSLTDEDQSESARVEVKYSAEEKSSNVDANNVVVSNNIGKADTVYVSNLTAADVVKVYDSASGGTQLGSATVGDSDTSAIVSISQLGTDTGSVYVSVTGKGKSESSRVQVGYSAESKSNTLVANNIVVTNNVGADDTVQVSGVSSGEVVNVYDAAKGGNLLGTATVASGSTSATIIISQLGATAGSAYVSLTDPNKLEGDRTQATYDAEGISSSVDPNNIVVTNNSGKADTVYASSLTAGDIVKVYDSASGGTQLGTATVGDSATSATVSINQLGLTDGSVYVSITNKNKSESSRVQVQYLAESKSNTLVANNIVVTNNVGAADTVQVSGVSTNQVVNVYDATKGGNLLGTATVASGSTSATISISQLGAVAGSVYVSLVDTNKLESDRVEADYSAEVTSDILSTSNVLVTNRSGSADTVDITGACQNDVIKVYDLAKGGNLLGSATVAAGNTKASISITQLGTSAGSIYVSRISSNKSESDRAKVDYLAEPKSTSPGAANISVTNNAGINDTVQVKGLSVNDLVQVYDSAQGGTLLGSATVANYATGATVSIPQLGTDGGNIYVSVTSTDKGESDRTQAGFSAEAKSNAPNANKVSIINNAGIAGTVKVDGLSGGDIVNVYDSAQGGTLLGSGTVGTYDTDATISVTQLGSDAGSVYVSATSKGKLESDRTQASYSAKLISGAPSASNITIENNSGISDTMEVVGLQPNDVVKVYNSDQGGDLLGSATASSDNMKANVTIAQLGVSLGDVYVSVTTSGKTESVRTKVGYSAESQSDPLGDGDVSIENNAGTSDVIDVTGVSENDVIKVYSATSGGTALATATVPSGQSEAMINVSQLGTDAGSVYVSVTRVGKTESSRTGYQYSAESTAPVQGNIYVVNNAVISDKVTVSGLIANDIVKVYDAAQNGNLLGYATVSANSHETDVTISQLTTNAGSVYVSVTNFGRGESKRTKADYIAEQTSAALYSGNVNIANNPSGTSDVITVSNLASSDVIKVYDASTGGNLIGTATVSSNGNQTSITIPQLGTDAGNVYISITNLGKNESGRTQVGYVAQN
jgi:hypothetical protein